MLRFASIGNRVAMATAMAAMTTASMKASARPGMMPIISAKQRDINTEGERVTTVYLGTDGVPAGFESAESSLVRVTVPSVGQTVEGSQRGTARAILLR